MKKEQHIVISSEEGLPLQKIVASLFGGLSLEEISSLFSSSLIQVNQNVASPTSILKEGDVVLVSLPDSLEDKIRETSLPITSFPSIILYEDSNLLIVNKPKGLLVQRNLAYGPSLESYARDYVSSKQAGSSVSSAHRLDRETSGCLVFGKNPESLSALGKAFMSHSAIKKTYWALVKGKLPEKGEITTPLGKDIKTGIVAPLAIEKGGKVCKTSYQRIKEYGDFTLLEVILSTGRTHQIRAHFASISHPLVGDEKYGDKTLNALMEEKYGLRGQFLHAHSLAFLSLVAPLEYLNGKKFVAPLPKEEEAMLEALVKK